MTLVLVHGGQFDSRYWEAVLSYLDAPTVTPDLRGRRTRPASLDALRLADVVESLSQDIRASHRDDLVLVGHSMAGIVLPGLLERNHSQVRQVVFIACTVPPEGCSLVDTLPVPMQEQLAALRPTPAGSLWDGEQFRRRLTGELPDDEIERLISIAVPEAYWPMREPVSLDGLRLGVPSTWVRLMRDSTLPAPLQDEMARRAGCHRVIDLDAGHHAPVSHPRELAAILDAVHDSPPVSVPATESRT